MNIIEPNLNGEHLRIGIVQARFTNEVGSAMLKAAVEKLHELGVKDDNITVTTVPGALEVPLVLQSKPIISNWSQTNRPPASPA